MHFGERPGLFQYLEKDKQTRFETRNDKNDLSTRRRYSPDPCVRGKRRCFETNEKWGINVNMTENDLCCSYEKEKICLQIRQLD